MHMGHSVYVRPRPGSNDSAPQEWPLDRPSRRRTVCASPAAQTARARDCTCAISTLPAEVVIGYDAIIHAYEDRTAGVFVTSQRGWGRFRRVPRISRTYSAGNTKQRFPVEADTVGRNITGTATVMVRQLLKKGRGLVRRFRPSGE